MKKLLLLLIIGVIVASCTGESSVNSTITRGGNFLTGDVSEKGGDAISNAKVKLFVEDEEEVLAKRLHEGSHLRCIDSTTSDKSGKYSFALDVDGYYILHVYVDDSLHAVSNVTYVANGEQIHNITITFTNSSASSQSDVDAALAILFKNNTNMITGSVPEFVAAEGLVLIDDFENSAGEATFLTTIGDTLYPGVETLQNGHNWYAKDSTAGSQGFPNYIEDSLFRSGFISNGDNHFLAQNLFLKGDAIDTANVRDEDFYCVGARLAKDGEFYDFTDVKRVKFYAAGFGSLRVILRGDFVDGYERASIEYSIQLTNEWTEYDIAIEDMGGEKWTEFGHDYAGLGWENIRHNVSSIEFSYDFDENQGGDELFLAIDNIVLDYNEITKNVLDADSLMELYNTALSSINGVVPEHKEEILENEVLLDDFQDNLFYSSYYSSVLHEDHRSNPNNQSDLGAAYNYYGSPTSRFYNAGYWFATNNADDVTPSYSFPDYVEDKEFQSLEGEVVPGEFLSAYIILGDNDGHNAHYEFTVPFIEKESTIPANAGENIYVDLTKLEAVEFYAAGSGIMDLVLYGDKQSDGSWKSLGKAFTLTDTWAKYTINVSDLIDAEEMEDTGIVSWDAIKEKMSMISFRTNIEQVTGDEIFFAVDNIVLKGVSYSDITYPELEVYKAQ